MIFSQIFENLDAGLVVLDRDLKVCNWNRWMHTYSKISAEEIIGRHLFDFYSELKVPWFLKNCKSVFTFGNFAFLSYKIHNYCFPFKTFNSPGSEFEFMRQNSTIGPIRNEKDEIDHIYIIVHDVTEIALFEKNLIEMNTRDGLTGIYNRRFLISRLEEEFERHKRYSRPMSLIMIDIDFFKKVNDTYGHQAGDYVLISLTERIAKRLRKTDVFSRYGGEEFCCILPETAISAAESLAENLRKAFSRKPFNYNGTKINITISQGVSELTDKIKSVDNLLKQADDALYKAKGAGRNKVVMV